MRTKNRNTLTSATILQPSCSASQNLFPCIRSCKTKIPSVAKSKFFRRLIIDETAEEKIKTPIHFSRTAFEFGNVGSAEIFIGSLLYGKRKHIIRNRRSKKMLLCFVYSKICPIFANCKQDGKNMNSYLFSLIIYRTFLNIKERDYFLSL